MKLLKGNNIDLLKKLDANSVDSIVTDPPYGLSFMNKKWDYDVPSIEFWKEVYRVLKPGGHVLSFGGTRTYHRMVINIEDAGFEIRDQIQWIYGSGFPKSLNIGKAVDKKLGNKVKKWPVLDMQNNTEVGNISKNQRCGICEKPFSSGNPCKCDRRHKANNEQEGLGTALKPANEPICLARKPLSEKTIVDNILKWGTGGLNIDVSRIETQDKINSVTHKYINQGVVLKGNGLKDCLYTQHNEGRFPANIIFDEDAAKLLDEQSDINASRFFYVAKVSKSERNMGLDGFEEVESKSTNLYFERPNGTMREVPFKRNTHPTVKPINLMSYLVKLITPVNGIVLDPFMGSGSTGIATLLNGYEFIGMEMDDDYFKIAESRINNFEQYRKFLK